MHVDGGLGGLTWVAIIIVGVAASIVQSAKRQRMAAQADPAVPERGSGAAPRGVQAQFGRDAVPVMPPVRVPVAIPRQRPAPPPAPPREELRPRRPAPFFADRGAVVRAVVVSEVLGKPRALRDEY